MSERVIWVDTAKGFAIISVVLGHSSLPIELRSVVYSFHMPLFFMLSGVFLFNSCITAVRRNFTIK